MGQFRCLNCRTLPLAGHRFCYVCGAAFPGPVPEAAVRAEAEVEGAVDVKRVSTSIAAFAGLLLLGIAKALLAEWQTNWLLGVVFLIGGACVLAFALQPKGKDSSAGGIALDVIRTAVLVLVLALAVGGGIVILFLVACKTIMDTLF
jgi:hypothetical protein